MKNYILLFFVIYFLACKATPKEIDSESQKVGSDTLGNLGKKEEIKVYLSSLECDCPQWIIVKNNRGTDESIYLERGDNSLINADTLYNGTNMPIVLLLEGNFYSKLGIPKEYHQIKRAPDSAKLFRYTKIKVLSKG